MGLLVHAMILGVTSIGGVVAGVRLGVWHAQLGVSAEGEAAAPDQRAMDPGGRAADRDAVRTRRGRRRGGDSAEPTA